MLTRAKTIFLTCSALSAFVIYKVHEYQNEERNVNNFIYTAIINKFKIDILHYFILIIACESWCY